MDEFDEFLEQMNGMGDLTPQQYRAAMAQARRDNHQALMDRNKLLRGVKAQNRYDNFVENHPSLLHGYDEFGMGVSPLDAITNAVGNASAASSGIQQQLNDAGDQAKQAVTALVVFSGITALGTILLVAASMRRK